MGTKKTPLEAAKEQMQEILNKKTADFETLKAKQEEARTKREEASLAMREATERMDIEAYEEAKNEKKKAQTALEMYESKFNQLKQQEYITEAESDKVVDSLLEYEKTLTEEFKAAVADPLKKLYEALHTYRAAVNDTESTIRAWGINIHANYNTRGRTTFYDEFTKQQTTRSKTPVPVRTMPYDGCAEATQMQTYLKQAEALYITVE